MIFLISGCFFAHSLLKKKCRIILKWKLREFASYLWSAIIKCDMTTCVALEWLNLSRNFVGHKASQLQYCHSEASLIRLKFAKKYKMLWTSEMFYNIIVNKALQAPPNLLWLDREQSLKNSMRYSSWKYCYQKLNILWSRQWRDTPTLCNWDQILLDCWTNGAFHFQNQPLIQDQENISHQFNHRVGVISHRLRSRISPLLDVTSSSEI